ncbi:Sas10/Utp3/C1D family-domain-containing protein [Infundibulicybe gibba]|nr:Sas10/Utp3/C1D family-domain-containing protein [Infundibulicybe gibba]
MASDTKKLLGKIATLNTSLDELDTLLEPLFSRTLPETTANLEPLQRAKLQTVLPYLIYDLVFTYLKSKGVDPRTHPVVPELDRVRRYFEKISKAENPPPKPGGIDKEAAGRFIKHAITQAKNTTMPIHTVSESSTSDVRVPTKVTAKMLERARYEKNLKERDAEESEEEELEVFGDGGDSDGGMDVDAQGPNVTDLKGKGRLLVSDTEPIESTSRKRRPTIDPFAGRFFPAHSTITHHFRLRRRKQYARYA